MKWLFNLSWVICLTLTSCGPAQEQKQEQGRGVGQSIVAQSDVAAIACGPCALHNWLAHGDAELQGVLQKLRGERTPVQTVKQIIGTYGERQSATKPGVTRYGPHNGGVGSVNLMIMARELLSDYLVSPPPLRGEYLQRLPDETTTEHLQRVTDWFSESIESGVPVLFYIRCYQRRDDDKEPRQVFGHHVVVTAIEPEIETTDSGLQRVRISIADSASGRAESGFLSVSDKEFTAPTFAYALRNGKAASTKKIRTGKPLLRVRILSYDLANPPKTRIVTAHFATFAEPAD